MRPTIGPSRTSSKTPTGSSRARRRRTKRPLVIAHRGASAYEPENSLAAFRAAVRLRADGVELDVHDTADGQLVVAHDPRLDGRPLAELTLAEIRQHHLPNGEPLATLSDVLSLLGTALWAFVEVKALSPAHDEALLAALDAGPAPTRYHVHSFDHRIVRRLKDRRPALVTGVLSSSYPIRLVEQIRDAGASELWEHESMIDDALVRAVHEAGVGVYAWTVDDPGRIEALAALGVDGICSNRPDLARDALR